MKGDEWMWTTGCSWKREKKLVGQSLPVGVGWAWNGAWPVRGMLPNAEELGLLPKASKLAKAPWEGVWPPKAGNAAKAGTAWGAAKGSPPMSASRSVLAFLTEEWGGG